MTEIYVVSCILPGSPRPSVMALFSTTENAKAYISSCRNSLLAIMLPMDYVLETWKLDPTTSDEFGYRGIP